MLANDGGIIRVPLMVKGDLVVPPEICYDDAENAFKGFEASETYVQLENAQVLREPVIGRNTMRYTGRYLYQVMPLFNPEELVEHDVDILASGLYRLSVDDILNYLDLVTGILMENYQLLYRVFGLTQITSEYPDVSLDNWVNLLASSMSRHPARLIIDRELSFGGKAGSNYLNGWVEVPGDSGDKYEIRPKQYVRAMPTRQLHITAGNVLEVPVISILRALLTKSAAVIKLPYGAVLPGVLFALAAVAGAPSHPITKNMSIVYWQGGDRKIEDRLFATGNFDRIVVWGGPETVSSVGLRALFTKVICFNPRYGISLVGREAFSGNLEEVASKATKDVMIYNQQACNSSLVHYVEGSQEQVRRYAETLCRVLEKTDQETPNFVPDNKIGYIKRMKRGKYNSAEWYVNETGGRFSSGVVVMPGDFNILDHPMCRLVFIKPVSSLQAVMRDINQFVSAAGIYPEQQRLELRDNILARGVSGVWPLGQCERLYPGMPHDGIKVLSQLVDWKNS